MDITERRYFKVSEEGRARLRQQGQPHAKEKDKSQVLLGTILLSKPLPPPFPSSQTDASSLRPRPLLEMISLDPQKAHAELVLDNREEQSHLPLNHSLPPSAAYLNLTYPG